MNCWQTFDDAFWLTLAGLVIGFGGMLIKACYKSKCSLVECCCFKVIREVEQEEKIDEIALQRQGSESDKT